MADTFLTGELADRKISNSPHVIRLSAFGITSDATNGLEYGATAPAGSTGQEAKIQAAIDFGMEFARISGATGLRVIWDVAVALGKEIYLGPNTTVDCPDFSCGAIARAQTYIHLIRVKGMDADMGEGRTEAQGATAAQALASQRAWGMFNPAYAGTEDQNFARLFDRRFILAKNITIMGGTWNGNQFQQTPVQNGGPDAYVNRARNTGWASCFQFNGVDGVQMYNVRCFLARQFVIWFSNCANISLIDVEAHNINHNNYNNDSIHFAGPCKEIRIINPRVHCADDCIAINADDVLGIERWGTPGRDWSCSGPITDVYIENMQITEGLGDRVGQESWGGVCFRSSVNRIDNVVIRGIYGRSSSWGVWAPNFYSNGTTLQQITGPGNIGHVVIEDMRMDLQPPYQINAAIAWALNTEHLVIRNRHRRNAQPCPDILIAGGAKIETLEVIDYSAYQAAGAVNNTQPVVRVAGTVRNFVFRGRTWRDPGIATSAAPILSLETINGSGSGNFPLTGSGAVDNAIIDGDFQGINNIVSVAANSSIKTLQLSGLHRLAAGGAPVANNGAVGVLLSGRLGFVGAQAYSGTAPAGTVYVDPTGAVSTATAMLRPAIYPAGANPGYLDGTIAGAASVPAALSVAFDGGSATNLANTSNALDYFSGSATFPANAGAHTVRATVDGATTSARKFVTASAGAATYLRSQFIPGTTGFNASLAAYTGSSKGDTGNAWNLTSTGNSTTPHAATVDRGRITIANIPGGKYPHFLSNAGAQPSMTTGWRFAIGDFKPSHNGFAMVVHLYSDAAQLSVGLGLALFNTSCQFQYANGDGNGQNIGPAMPLPDGWATAGGDIDIDNDGTNVVVSINGTQVGTVPVATLTAGIPAGLFGGTYIGFTPLSINTNALTLSVSTISHTGR